ncbi:MAG: winged helix-turn-helix transcriptional regulator [Alphaproteobacteria bacterium]|jgi:DNA-binding MarR family transcriptional regulator
MPRARAETAKEVSVQESTITLGVLTAIERDPAMTQRSAASEVGVALGLVNAYLKRCVRKGWVKIQQVPRKRYVYYLTPRGFAEKARLTSEYLSFSLDFFRRARAQYDEAISACALRGWKRVIIVGETELAEIASLCCHDREVVPLGVLALESQAERFAGLPVFASLDRMPEADAAILALAHEPAELGRALAVRLGAQRVLAPPILRLPTSGYWTNPQDLP